MKTDIHRNNRNYKKIRCSLQLTVEEVAKWMGVSKNLVSQWSRSPTATKLESGRDRQNRRLVSRYKIMTDEQFDIFCSAIADNIKAYKED